MIERAIMHGTILNAASVRNMFTSEVIPLGGDTDVVLWDAYLHSVYDPLENIIDSICTFPEYELYERLAGQWVLKAVIPYTFTGTSSSDQVPNQMALVLVGKALGVRKMGRKFFGGLGTDFVVGNGLDAGSLIQAGVALAGYLTPFTGIGGGTITPGILDKTEIFHPFVGGLVSAFLGTMRRRKPGVGI
jgi:hypothetical protein